MVITMQDPKTLFISDNISEATKISGWLNSWGYVVSRTGWECEALAKSDLINYDIILIDLYYNNNRILDAVSSLRSYINIPIIFMSSLGFKNPPNYFENSSFLVSPVDPLELKFTMEMCIYKHEMEKLLQESENRYKALVENIEDSVQVASDYGQDTNDRENFFYGILNDMHSFVAVLNPSGEVIFVNNTPLKLIGKTLGDIEGELFHETPWWNYSEKAIQSIKNDIKLCSAGKTLEHQIKIKTLNGFVWIDFCMHPVYDNNGNIQYLVPEGRDISVIKTAKKELQLEKNRLMNITENSPSGMVLIDKNGTYKYINPKFQELFGYSLDEIRTGKEWFQKVFKNPEKRRDAMSAWKNDFKNAHHGVKKPRTFTVTCKNNEEKVINFVPVLLPDNDYLMTVEDVTERIVAEKSLKQSEERFRTLANSAVDAIIITDVDGKIVFSNESLQKIFGYYEHDIMGKYVNMLMPGRYKDEFIRNQEEFKLTGRHTLSGKLFESYGHRNDGSEFPIEISITTWEVSGDKFTTSIIRDITERKLVEYELKGSEEKFRQMTENMDEVFWIIDPQMSQILYISPAYSRVWGCSRESLFDNPKSWIESIHPADRKQVIDTIFRTPYENQPNPRKSFDYRIIRPDGSIRWIRGRTFPLKNGGNKIKRIAGISTDITLQKKAEDKYRNLFNNLKVGVFRNKIGANGKIVEANPALLEMFGYKLSEILAIKSSYLYQDRYDKINFDEKIIKLGCLKNQLINFRRKDGTPFTASVSAYIIKDDLGNIEYYDAVMEDITRITEMENIIETIDPSTIRF